MSKATEIYVVMEATDGEIGIFDVHYLESKMIPNECDPDGDQFTCHHVVEREGEMIAYTKVIGFARNLDQAQWLQDRYEGGVLRLDWNFMIMGDPEEVNPPDFNQMESRARGLTALD